MIYFFRRLSKDYRKKISLKEYRRTYQKKEIKRFLSLLHPYVKRILEIGCDLNGEVAFIMAKETKTEVIGINNSPDFLNKIKKKRNNCHFLNADACNLPFPDNYFDAVLSIAVLEHIKDIELCLWEIYRVLKIGGLAYINFGSIWSSATGHHVWLRKEVNNTSKDFLFIDPDKNPIPDYGHLLMKPKEMRKYLKTKINNKGDIEKIIKLVYHSSYLNRYFFEDYIDAFFKIPWAITSICFSDKYEHTRFPDKETLKRLYKECGDHNYICPGMRVICKKLNQIN